ncbi:tetratricopeptide repeat protein [candidate division CSSED10-310 bacterium]|uniref:Tetratricopeptide repeat protein n=1 Tax=candidate division CSSED10-310 bacterium TaxID=2855610 RepID=A0ABV6YY71_UNCC1
MDHPPQIGPYIISELLGAGGMGVVYRGYHESNREQVALKTIRVVDEAQLEGIRREIRALARIRHPGIVRILEQGIHDQLPWYAMELLEGVTLRQFFSGAELHRTSATSQFSRTGETSADRLRASEKQLKRVWWTNTLVGMKETFSSQPSEEHALSPGTGSDTLIQEADVDHGDIRQILCLVRRLCAPLAFLHGEGMVHRDLKPENIIIEKGEQPVLVDFGLMTQFSGRESREMLVVERGASGTVHYMAPEQIRGEFVDARADLYALGCILYELLIGHPPFMSGEPARIIHAHLNTIPTSLSKLRPEVSPELEAFILRLLAKEPRDRLGYADRVATMLARLGGEEGVVLTGPQPRTYLYRSRFAGRTANVTQLRSYCSQTQQKKGSLILVGGESGVGKTRLVMEFGREAASQQMLVLTGECSTTAGRPLEAFQGLLQKIADRCRQRGGAETDRLLGRRGKVLSLYHPALTNLPGQENYPEPVELNAAAAKLRLFSYLADTLTALTQDCPVLLIIDDLQWADDLVFGLLEFMVRTKSFERFAIIIIATYRSEAVNDEIQHLINSPAVKSIHLERLDLEATATIVSDMMAVTPAPRLFCRYLARQSEGNPYFIVEYLRTAVNQGLFSRDEHGRWQVRRESEDDRATMEMYESLSLPVSLQGLIEHRLAALPAEARKLVSAAAVVGREIRIQLLAEMMKQNHDTIFDLITDLADHQIMEKPTSHLIRFYHAKIREVALTQLEPEARRQLHQTAAVGLEKICGAECDDFLAELGRHWHEAGNLEKARSCYRGAARRAINQYDHGEAERLATAYLNLVQTPTTDSIKIRNQLGDEVLHLQGRNQEAIKQHTQAIQEARKLSDRNLEAEGCRFLGGVLHITGNIDEAFQLYEQALTLACDEKNKRLESVALNNLASIYHDQGRLDQALALNDQALDITRQIGDRGIEERILSNLAVLCFEQGQIPKAFSLFEQAFNIAQETGNRPEQGRILGNLAGLHHEQGHDQVALTLFQQALAITQEVGYRRVEGIILGNMASLHHEHGLIEEALPLYEQALIITREIENRKSEAITLGNLANLRKEQGKLPAALGLYEQALTIARNIENKNIQGWILGNMISVYGDQGYVTQAQAISEQALTMARDIDARDSEANTLFNMATLERRIVSDLARVEDKIKQAQAIYHDLNKQFFVGLCCCQRGHCALARGLAATPFLSEAHTIENALATNPQSELSKAINQLHEAQKSYDHGQHHLLFQGELVADIPPGLADYLKKSGHIHR